jgi:hypothetical protein
VMNIRVSAEGDRWMGDSAGLVECDAVSLGV